MTKIRSSYCNYFFTVCTGLHLHVSIMIIEFFLLMSFDRYHNQDYCCHYKVPSFSRSYFIDCRQRVCFEITFASGRCHKNIGNLQGARSTYRSVVLYITVCNMSTYLPSLQVWLRHIVGKQEYGIFD